MRLTRLPSALSETEKARRSSRATRSRFGKRRTKAGQLLEFTLLIPMACVLISFSADMGRLVLATTSLADASAVAARAGARIGYAGTVTGSADCGPGYTTDNPAYAAFCESADILAGAQIVQVTIPTPVNSGYCEVGSDETEFVTVKAKANIDFITPGLSTLVKLSTPSRVMIEVAGTARCEVTR